MYPAWAHTAEEVLQNFDVDPRHGLSNAEVEKRREQYGYNEFEHEPPVPLWRLVLQQFDDTLVKVLLLAAGISFALAWLEESGDDPNARLRAFMEPGVIVLILVLNAAVGVWQESNAESALEALKEMSADTAKVWRDGALVSALPCRELVPGDVVELHTGDRVPADVRLTRLHTAVLRAEQSALTGESVAVCKSAAAVCESADCELQAKECVMFGGTGVASGSATAVVHATGMSTEMGLIQRQIREAAAEDSDTPLKQMLDSFGESLARLILWVCVAVWLINWRHFLSWETRPGSAFLPDWSTVAFSLDKATFYFKVAVALAVAAIPEGLPAVITTCLALGTRKMAQRRAIV
ncbi:E1-E2 ATPase, partial [Helicosporidium sp. ATCC 50920]